ncbi:MAG: LPS assembly lipoprotein LptE [Alphaproteobacteria bacterium]|nr:LPS assembly lipoprotein LptE [Alphaproteobacteria bacterium]
MRVKFVAAIATMVAITAIGLAACGFRPLYLEQTSRGSYTVPDALASIDIEPIADRRGQMLRNNLLDRMTPRGQPGSPRYVLRTNLSESIRQLAVRRDDSSTRANLILTASFRLYEVGQDEPILTGSVRSSNNHSISISDIATLAAERSARERGTRDIANRMTLQIGAFLQARSSGLAAAQ